MTTESPDDLVPIATFKTPIEGELAKIRLESEGIPSYLGNEATIGVMPFLANGLGGVTIQVIRKHAARAREILNVE